MVNLFFSVSPYFYIKLTFEVLNLSKYIKHIIIFKTIVLVKSMYLQGNPCKANIMLILHTKKLFKVLKHYSHGLLQGVPAGCRGRENNRFMERRLDSILDIVGLHCL